MGQNWFGGTLCYDGIFETEPNVPSMCFHFCCHCILYNSTTSTTIVLYVGTDRLNERISTQVAPDFLSYAGYAL